MGLSGIPTRSALAGALNQRDWHIYHALAMRLILRARDLYAKKSTGLKLDAMRHFRMRPLLDHNKCGQLENQRPRFVCYTGLALRPHRLQGAEKSCQRKNY